MLHLVVLASQGAAEAAGMGCAGGIGGNGAAHVVAGKGAEALEVAPAPAICGDSSTIISELLVGKVSWLLGRTWRCNNGLIVQGRWR